MSAPRILFGPSTVTEHLQLAALGSDSRFSDRRAALRASVIGEIRQIAHSLDVLAYSPERVEQLALALSLLSESHKILTASRYEDCRALQLQFVEVDV